MNETFRTNRRSFIRKALSAGIVAPAIVPATALGRGGAVPPSDRITLGAIGLGARCRHVLGHFLNQPEIQVPIVSDCFADRRKAGKDIVDQHYGNKDCAVTRFHEEILDRKDIDAVLVATGDRWHSVMSVLASKAGKDVYCEKPASLAIGETRALVDEFKRSKRIWQCGTQRRSNPGYRFVVDIVKSGRIGTLQTITTANGCGASFRVNGVPKPEPEPGAELFWYDRWLGQSPRADYSEFRVRNWRLNWSTGGGTLVDMGPHYLNFAQWAHDSEDSTAEEFEGEGTFFPSPNFNNTPYFYNVRALYRDGVRIYITSGKTKGVRFDGDKGWIWLSDEGEIEVDNPRILRGLKQPESNWKILTPHLRDFIDCVRTRKQTIANPERMHRVHVMVHAANLSLRLGRKLRWDTKNENFIDDEEASRMITRPMRDPWNIV